jgi:mitogen-activated protein kinase 15
LKFIHSAGLLHRDIKPSNILVDSSCLIKICDFGLCRSISSEERPEDIEYTDYVATRWYRSPEVLMGSRRYDIGIDLWSVGCIIGEMFHCRPLIPGSSTATQLEMIFELTGNPTSEDVASWRSPYARAMLNDVQAKCRVSLDELCRDQLPRDAKGLMKCLFRLDPNKRGTSDVALGHCYLADIRDPRQETAYPHGPIRIGISDCAKLTADEYRRRIYSIIAEAREGPESNRMYSRSDSMNEVPSAVSYDSMEIIDNTQV